MSLHLAHDPSRRSAQRSTRRVIDGTDSRGRFTEGRFTEARYAAQYAAVYVHSPTKERDESGYNYKRDPKNRSYEKDGDGVASS
jgi:hypothetical protein